MPHSIILPIFTLWFPANLASTITVSGFPGSSAGKESACNAGDPGSIPGSGSLPGEGIGYILQYSWGSPVAQAVKNSPAIQETWVWSLGCEEPLEEGMATLVFLPGESLWTEEPGGPQSMGSQRVRHDWMAKHNTAYITFSGKHLTAKQWCPRS